MAFTAPKWLQTSGTTVLPIYLRPYTTKAANGTGGGGVTQPTTGQGYPLGRN